MEARLVALRNSQFAVVDRHLYLNHAGIGPLPQRAVAALADTADGLSLVAAGLPWQEGDTVVGVAGEYPSAPMSPRWLPTNGCSARKAWACFTSRIGWSTASARRAPAGVPCPTGSTWRASSSPTTPARTATELVQHLLERGVATAERRGRLRLSPHFYNTEEEIERCLGVLEEMARR
jgi:selenocysteine lyase/cysteine desulfurase